MTKKIVNRIDDTYSITLPFTLNEDQIDALRKIDDFIRDPDSRVLTISGWAGTGKTTLMTIVKDRYWLRPRLQFAATTHKAAAVLREKVGTKVFTVNSLFGILIETDMDGDDYDISRKKRKYDEENLMRGSVVIIDEASMLSEENYRDVMEKSKEKQCKVIFIGDPAQLAPVNEDDISIVFRDSGEDGRQVLELTRVERTDDVPILEEATRVRTYGHLSYETNVNDKGGVEYITSPEELTHVMDEYMSGLKKNPNWFRILTYTNRNVENLNTLIRKKLGYGTKPERGEPLMSYANWGYVGKNTYKFINSESYTVTETAGERDIDLKDTIGDGEGVTIHIIDLKIKSPTGDKQTIPYIDIRNDEDSRHGVMMVCQEKLRLWKEWKSIPMSTPEGKQRRNDIVMKINELDRLLFVNDNVYDDTGHMLCSKVVDFGYAHTIHKSQGSTFEHVVMNDMDIENHCRDEKVKRQLRYVGLTRARRRVVIMTTIRNRKNEQALF